MKKNEFTVMVFLVLSFLGISMSYAQESFNASGKDASGSGGTVNYSVGQIVYTTNIGSSGSSAQGVQHAYEILTLSKDETLFSYSISLFPNPATDNLILNVGGYKNEAINYFIYDLQGKKIKTGNIESNQSIIDISQINNGVYYMDINKENKKVQSFKIIKN
ncbi:MAG: T9SS type A sorting domain-containing protein [Bacteroidota bacterium]|jgi:hypothetical protein